MVAPKIPPPPSQPAPAPPLPAAEAACHPSFPISALGPHLSAAATAVASRTQAPIELVSHHILTLAAMAAQRLVSIRLPTGQASPVSCWFVTLVDAAERPAAAEKMVVGSARAWERAFVDTYRKRMAAHIAAAIASPATSVPGPVQHLDLFDYPGNPSRYDRYGSYGGMRGLFLRHPHDLIQTNRCRRPEAVSLGAVWEGKVKTQAVGPTLFPRLSLHLVATPREGAAFLTDRVLGDAGLVGRMLAVQPASRIGERAWSPAERDDPPPEFENLLVTLCELYEKPATTDTRVLGFSAAAKHAWLAFAHEVEKGMAKEGDYAAIRPFAVHLAENAARLAAVIAFMNDGALTELSESHLETGIALGRYYAREALRLATLAPPALSEAEKAELLCDWLRRTRADKEVGLREICQSGPPPSRDADTAYALMRRLERLGLVEVVRGAARGAQGPRRPGVRYRWHVETAEPQVSRSVA